MNVFVERIYCLWCIINNVLLQVALVRIKKRTCVNDSKTNPNTDSLRRISKLLIVFSYKLVNAAQKMKFSIKSFFSA